MPPSPQAWVRVPAGRFPMGSAGGADDERPVHEVELDAFEMAVHPVTQADYAAFLRATDHAAHAAPRGWPGADASGDLPVTGVSWLDADAYCAWRRSQGEALRLPTEAEWEWAARGGLADAAHPWGEGIPAWVPDGGRGPQAGPWPVTVGVPNGFGLYGIGTNVHEWCADWYAADYYARAPLRNPQGPPTGSRRSSRGGSWRHRVTVSRCAARSSLSPSFRYADYGFRVVRAQPPRARPAMPANSM